MLTQSLSRWFVIGFTTVAAATLLASPSAAQHGWAELARYPSVPRNLYDAEVVLVDLDGDDYMDLVMSGFETLGTFDRPARNPLGGIYAHHVSLVPGDSGVDTTLTYQRLQVTNLEAISNAAIAAADYDNDGRPDVAVAGLYDQSYTRALIIQQTDSLYFTWHDGAYTPVKNGSLDWGDYNNDGRVDLLVTGTGAEAATTHLFQNLGGTLFQRVEADLPPVAHGSAVWGDSDNDGDLDVLLTGARDGESFYSGVFLNEGGEFVDAHADLPELAFSSARWADLNGDGLLDILLAGAEQSPLLLDGRVYTLLNQGGNTFTDVPNNVDGFYDGDLEVGDWNGDGTLDIGVSGKLTPLYSTSPARFFEFTGEGIEELISVFHALDLVFAPGDYDRDGDLDWFLTGFNPESTGLDTPIAAFYTNVNQTANEPPNPPSGLSAAVSGRSVQLSWQPGSDEATPAPGLTYALRVGSSPGAVDINAPMASPATGLRYICRQGNVFHNTAWRLHDLPPGTYYWSVQTVDNRCGGSAFAPEGTFEITGTATGSESPDKKAFQLRLHTAHPNPFADQTRITFELPADGSVDIVLYDMVGREVRNLVHGSYPSGTSSVVWDGRDDSGVAAAPGLYAVRITSKGRTDTRTVLLVR